MKIVPAHEKVDLRRGIDHIGVTACAILHDGKGNVLLMKRGPKARDERGRWDICGGAVEFGESIDDAIKREVKEELCVTAKDVVFIAAGDAHRFNHDGDKTHWIWLLHSVQVDPREVKIGEPDKITELGWFNTSNLPSPLHSQFPTALEEAKRVGVIK